MEGPWKRRFGGALNADLDPLARTLRTDVLAAAPNDLLREGFASLSLTHALPDPLGDSLKTAPYREEIQELQFQSAVYGTHAPFRLVRERALVAETRRLAPLPSSMFSLELAMGQEDNYDFSDAFKGPTPEDRCQNLSIHQQIEKRSERS